MSSRAKRSLFPPLARRQRGSDGDGIRARTFSYNRRATVDANEKVRAGYWVMGVVPRIAPSETTTPHARRRCGRSLIHGVLSLLSLCALGLPLGTAGAQSVSASAGEDCLRLAATELDSGDQKAYAAGLKTWLETCRRAHTANADDPHIKVALARALWLVDGRPATPRRRRAWRNAAASSTVANATQFSGAAARGVNVGSKAGQHGTEREPSGRAKKVRAALGGEPPAREPGLGDGEGWGRDRARVSLCS